jgi:type I restriction enzyme S subunit
MDLKFRAYAFKTKHFYRQCYEFCEGSGQRYVIAQDYFREFTIGFPPYEEQRRIGSILFANDQLINGHKQALDRLKLEKVALMQQLLTGKWRVTV